MQVSMQGYIDLALVGAGHTPACRPMPLRCHSAHLVPRSLAMGKSAYMYGGTDTAPLHRAQHGHHMLRFVDTK
jgi:hypothetical protein